MSVVGLILLSASVYLFRCANLCSYPLLIPVQLTLWIFLSFIGIITWFTLASLSRAHNSSCFTVI